MSCQAHETGTASEWIRRWTHLIPPGGAVLDVACGYGRHVRWLAGRGHAVVAVDRSAEALDSLRSMANSHAVERVQADIENGPWPLVDGEGPRRFDAVVVTNYLWRPLFPTLLRSLSVNGVLLVETFATGNGSVGKPSRPDFLLATGELLRECAGLRVVAFEDGFCDMPERFVQRIAAVRVAPRTVGDGAVAVTPRRYPL